MQQPPSRCVGPAPLGDLGQEVGDRVGPAGLLGDRQPPAAPAGRLGERDQVGLDVAAAVEFGQRPDDRVDLGEEAAEERQPSRHAADGAGGAGDALARQVDDEPCAQRCGDAGQEGDQRAGLACQP
jgi:hypothetical protein